MTDEQKPQGDTSKATIDGEVVMSFANYPESLAEHRAHKNQDGALWSPRDALIDMLRRIDSGELKPRACIVVVDYDDEDGEGCTAFNASSPTYLHTVGLAGRLFFSVNERAYRD